MNELHAILDAWREVDASSEDAVLATVMHVQGSAYRRPGARMLILPDGRRIGSISGGCLESDLAGKCWWMTESGEPTVRVYDTTSDDDAVWEFGLGCNGVVHVMLERTSAAASRQTFRFLTEWRESGGNAAMATALRASEETGVRAGDRLFIGADGVCGGNLRGSAWERELLFHVRAAQRVGRNRLVHMGDVEAFVECLARPMSLVIFGAGHDAVPVAAIAKQMGWHVTVADGRPAYAKASRFPGVDRVVVMSSRNLLADIEIGPETAVVMMTHNYPQDARLLPLILPKRPWYLGLLGPKKRTTRLFDEIDEDLEAADVHAPVGLDIGADTPEGIAVSIVAEIRAALAGRSGGMLRSRSGSIHPAADEVGQRSRAMEPVGELVACSIER
ncbi:MAG: XdhC family protein [Bryobacteraceae bacterium]